MSVASDASDASGYLQAVVSDKYGMHRLCIPTTRPCLCPNVHCVEDARDLVIGQTLCPEGLNLPDRGLLALVDDRAPFMPPLAEGKRACRSAVFRSERDVASDEVFLNGLFGGKS